MYYKTVYNPAEIGMGHLETSTRTAPTGADLKEEFELAWKTFGGYKAEKKRLYRTVVRPWKYHIMETASISSNSKAGVPASSIETALVMTKPSGVLFHGPPGCGKTFAAMCLASSLGLHCVKVSLFLCQGLPIVVILAA